MTGPNATPSRPENPARRLTVAWTLALMLLAVVGFAACQRDSGDRLVLTGSSTMAPLVGDLAKKFEASHTGVRVDVQTGGSSRGVADARQGLASIGMVSRALGPAESDLTPHTIALDGVTLIVHASNPVRELSDAQVIAIFTGGVQRWNEIGGADAPITVVHKADGRSTQEIFLHHFGIDPIDVKPSIVIGDNEQGIKSVAGNPDAIGYVSVGTAEASVQAGTPIKLLSLAGVMASSETIASGRFPLARKLNLVTSGTPEALAAEFIAFARSPGAHSTIEAHFFVPVD